MNNIVGVIPARFASTRFPGKPLTPIAGKPMILHVLERVSKAKSLSQVFVATDDKRIHDFVIRNGHQSIMTSSSLTSGTDRIAEAIKVADIKADIVVNIQGDEPLIEPKMIDELVSPFLQNTNLLMTTLGHRISGNDLQNQNIVKVVVDDLGFALYFSRFPIPYSREVSTNPTACLKHIGLYAYTKHFLFQFCKMPPHPLEIAESLEQLRALAMGAKIQVVKTDYQSIGVDTPEDVKKVEGLL